MIDRRTAILCLTGAIAGASGRAHAQRNPSLVTVDRIEGRGRGRRPGVLLLHGADGVTRRERYLSAAGDLAARGFTVLFPHYLEVSGDRRASYGEIQTKYPLWSAGLQSVVDEAARDPRIDGRRLAIVGVSLGGALALSLAARDPRIKAVVSYYGFLPSDLSAGRLMAPTLILHGARDFLVPVGNADQIEAILRAGGSRVEKQIYADQGHGFAQSAAADAATRAGDFLRRYLGS